MINRVVLVGRLTRNVELRKTQNGKSVASFTVALDRGFDGEQADFVNCVAWEKTAEFMATYLGKGSLIALDGRLQSRSYENKEGKNVYVLEVVADNLKSLERKKESHEDKLEYEDFNDAHLNNDSPSKSPVLDIHSDDLPF